MSGCPRRRLFLLVRSPSEPSDQNGAQRKRGRHSVRADGAGSGGCVEAGARILDIKSPRGAAGLLGGFEARKPEFATDGSRR